MCGRGPPGGGLTPATVIGTLTLPGSAQAKGTVAIYTTPPPGGTPVASSGVASTGGSASIPAVASDRKVARQHPPGLPALERRVLSAEGEWGA